MNLIDQIFRVDLMLWALALNAVLFAIALIVFVKLVDSARDIGSLMAVGE